MAQLIEAEVEVELLVIQLLIILVEQVVLE
jgi:hypothetical protein